MLEALHEAAVALEGVQGGGCRGERICVRLAPPRPPRRPWGPPFLAAAVRRRLPSALGMAFSCLSVTLFFPADGRQQASPLKGALRPMLPLNFSSYLGHDSSLLQGFKGLPLGHNVLSQCSRLNPEAGRPEGWHHPPLHLLNSSARQGSMAGAESHRHDRDPPSEGRLIFELEDLTSSRYTARPSEAVPASPLGLRGSSPRRSLAACACAIAADAPTISTQLRERMCEAGRLFLPACIDLLNLVCHRHVRRDHGTA